jgi:hypothetical protein
MKTFLCLLIATLGVNLFSALPPIGIPRSSLKKFRTEGLFEGGSRTPANIETIRLANHKNYERWVIDFSDVDRKQKNNHSPRFQLRYIAAENLLGPEGDPIIDKPARFLFTFRNIRQNYLSKNTLKQLLARSSYVKDIIVYPPIEAGDTALEMILKSDVKFEPHQPLEGEGRLVLDLRR